VIRDQLQAIELSRVVTERIGKYVIYESFAAGGMATVHPARQVGPMGFARIVAVKRLHKKHAMDSELSVMLLDEARLSARIQNQFVVQTLDCVAESGELLIVMEYVHGESLARLVKRAREHGAAVDISVALALLTNVLHGLHAAHELTDENGQSLGLVHRDVSPQNVIVAAEGVAKILDFGVAKSLGRAQTTLEGQIKGKLAYMSPEQFNSELVDRRTDVYAASIVLWELLTGARLFGGADESTTLGKLLRGEVPAPSAIRSDVPVAIDRIILRGLARDPAMRWLTARDMALALEEAGPIASASRVGAWVAGLAANELTERRNKIAEIERSGPGGAKAPTQTEGEETKSAQGVSVAGDTRWEGGKRSSRRWWLVLAPVLPLGLAGAFAWKVFGVTREASRTPQAISANAPQSVPPPSSAEEPKPVPSTTAGTPIVSIKTDAGSSVPPIKPKRDKRDGGSVPIDAGPAPTSLPSSSPLPAPLDCKNLGPHGEVIWDRDCLHRLENRK